MFTSSVSKLKKVEYKARSRYIDATSETITEESIDLTIQPGQLIVK